MPMYNLIEYSDNYSKTSGSLWQYCKEIPAVNNHDNIVSFDGANATDSFNFKTKINGQTNDNGKIDVEILVPLKYLSNFWRSLEMRLINCEYFGLVSKLCYNFHRYCKSSSYICNNKDKSLCSSRYFINSRECKIITRTKIRF